MEFKEVTIMSKKLSGLGRGIDAIFLENTVEEPENTGGPQTLKIAQLEPKGDQPRKYFDTEALSQLAESIAAHGVLQPILVRKMEDGRYQIIAGERRFRAAKMAGLNEVPVVIMDSGEQQAAQIALIENVQREDLNPLEEAAAYRSLATEYHLSQEEIARQIGKSRSAIANALRLLDLPEEVRPMLASGELSAGHARALLGLRTVEDITTLAHTIVERGLSVRMTEEAVRKMNRRRTMLERAADDEEEESAAPVVDYGRELERRVMKTIGRRVKLNTKRGKKCITFFYEDNEDLENFLRTVCGKDFFEEF